MGWLFLLYTGLALLIGRKCGPNNWPKYPNTSENIIWLTGKLRLIVTSKLYYFCFYGLNREIAIF